MATVPFMPFTPSSIHILTCWTTWKHQITSRKVNYHFQHFAWGCLVLYTNNSTQVLIFVVPEQQKSALAYQQQMRKVCHQFMFKIIIVTSFLFTHNYPTACYYCLWPGDIKSKTQEYMNAKVAFCCSGATTSTVTTEIGADEGIVDVFLFIYHL